MRDPSNEVPERDPLPREPPREEPPDEPDDPEQPPVGPIGDKPPDDGLQVAAVSGWRLEFEC